MRSEDWVGLHHFTMQEFSEPEEMNREFVQLLDRVRAQAGVPFKITSSFREGDGQSTHHVGLAVDIKVGLEGSCQARHEIVAAAHALGVTRVGFYDRHIHLDIGDRVDPVKWAPYCMWWGKSK